MPDKMWCPEAAGPYVPCSRPISSRTSRPSCRCRCRCCPLTARTTSQLLLLASHGRPSRTCLLRPPSVSSFLMAKIPSSFSRRFVPLGGSFFYSFLSAALFFIHSSRRLFFLFIPLGGSSLDGADCFVGWLNCK